MTPSDMRDQGVTTSALVPCIPPNIMDRALAWADLPDDERRRRATAAAQAHDAAALADLAADWLLLHGKKGARASPLTRRRYRACALGLVAAWRGEDLLHPKRLAATRWLRGLEGQGLTPSTTRVHLAAARALYAALRTAGATTDDPFRDLHPAPDPTARWEKRGPYADEEVDRLLAVADADNRLLILLGAHAGLRVAEMLALVWEDVDLAGGRLVVKSGKGGKQRTVEIGRTLDAELAVQRTPSGPLLRWRTDGKARRRLQEVCRAAGVPYRGIHSLRHTFGTRLYRETDLQTTSRMLGHAGVEVTTVYAKWSDEAGRTAIRAW